MSRAPAGSLQGIRVLELVDGVAGAMTGMLLADHGAEVVKVEPPGGDATRALPGSPVWNRGKRSLVLDPEHGADRDRLRELLGESDVLVETLAPREAARLGLEHRRLAPGCPRLVHVSITGYGRDNPHSDRPAVDALVAARSGMQWEQRSWFGAPTDHLAGIDDAGSAWPVPPRAEQTGHRDGPIFLAHPWPSIGAALLATAGALAALLAREQTGRGQLVEASLLQGVLLQSGHLWQDLADPRLPGYRLWYYDRRAPKGLFECADGLWLHQWPPIDHGFAAAAARGDALELPDEDAVRAATPPGALAMGDGDYEELVRLQAELNERTAQSYLKFPRAAWVEALSAAGRGVAEVRSPEEALTDGALRADGAIAEVEDPQHGPIRMMGVLQGMTETPGSVRGPAPLVGEQTARPWAAERVLPGRRPGAPPAHALEGVVVLDFGLAMAGPFGPQLLADLGADVIKVHALRPGLLDHASWMAIGVERGKRSIAIDLKHPGAREVLEPLVRRADVVHHNMRVGVAERLGIDEASLRPLNERLIYCHTLGWERDGPRTHLPGTDQMGNALGGTEYEAGGVHAGGRPVWHPNSMGDLGNGALSALVVLQALLHRARGGAGQRVDTSIAFTTLLFNSFTWIDARGRGPERPRIDAQQLGTGPLYRLYRASDGWICIAVTTEEQWRGLLRAVGEPGLDAIGFAPPWTPPRPADETLAQRLELAFAEAPAREWLEKLDRAGVPCEISSAGFARELFDDPGSFERGWLAAYEHPTLGRLAQPGCLVDLSDTPGIVRRPSPLTGQHTREILAELGLDDAAIERLHADGVVDSWKGA